MLTRLLTTLCGALVGVSPAIAGEMVPVPEAIYRVQVERSVFIAMRDGTRLSTDLYFPIGAGERMPVVLIRTPYSKTGFNGRMEQLANIFAGQGFVTAMQDARGRFESEGDYMPQLGDADDGFDTVAWLAAQPWSNGRVGSYGCSYLGDVQILMAQRLPPALKAMIPQAAGSSIGSAGGQYKYFGARRGGAIEFAQNISWFKDNGKLHFRAPPGLTREQFLALAPHFDPTPRKDTTNYADLWWHLPTRDVMRLAKVPPNDFADLATRAVDDPWWDQFHYMTDRYQSDVPALHVNSWYDFGVREVIYEFDVMRKRSLSKKARDNQFLMISPTTHCRSERITDGEPIGERPMGDPRFGFWDVYIKWFNHWLRGEPTGSIDLPRVRYYLMGANEWRAASDWPIPGTVVTRYYLRSGGRANSRFGDGELATRPPSSSEPADQFTYDPAKPVPTLGGPVCCTGNNLAAGSFDQRDLEMRHDVLVYTTPPLEHDVEVTGEIDAVLYVSSDAKDTDFTAKLVDVYPDGRAFNVQDGIIRARVREGQTKSVWMEPGRVYPVTLDMGATGNLFAKGHRIRLEVSSSNFPRFDRNLNTGGNNYDETDWKIARNAVHHRPGAASYIALPVVPRR